METDGSNHCHTCGHVTTSDPCHLCGAENNDAGYLSTELLTVLSLSIIPVTLVVVWVAKMAAMVAAV